MHTRNLKTLKTEYGATYIIFVEFEL